MNEATEEVIVDTDQQMFITYAKIYFIVSSFITKSST
jgi:hypothetical protein